MNAEIKRRIQEGRWEIVGGMWVEPDLNMPDGESLVRQLLVGKRWYKQAYGVDVRIGWNPDSFGYTWQLPQIYKKSGIDYFVTQKMAWNDTNQLPFKLFWWQSPDGSKVLTYFPHDYGNENLSPVRLARRSGGGAPAVAGHDGDDGPLRRRRSRRRTHARHARRGLPLGRALCGIVAANGGEPVTPKYQFGTAQSFFSTVEKADRAARAPSGTTSRSRRATSRPPAVPGKVAIPTWNSELYFEYHRGVMTTQANHKHNMRDSEEEVLNAEKWSSLAWLDGAKYPARRVDGRLEEGALQPVPRSGGGVGHRASSIRMRRRTTTGCACRRMRFRRGRCRRWRSGLIHAAKEAKLIPIVVYNPLGWERSGDVIVKRANAGSTRQHADYVTSRARRCQQSRQTETRNRSHPS